MWEEKQASKKRNSAKLKRDLTELKAKKKVLCDSRTTGKITHADFDDFYGDLENQTSALEAELAGNMDLGAGTILDYLKHLVGGPGSYGWIVT